MPEHQRFAHVCLGLSLLGALLAAPCSKAQNLPGGASEGLYEEDLYEIEVSIFSNRDTRTEFAETLNPETVTLQYPARLALLQPSREPLAFDFSRDKPAPEPEDELALEAEPGPESKLEETGQDNNANGGNDLGPPYSPATGAFHLPLSEHDAYAPLNGTSDSFNQYNQRLQNASQYQLLWHGRWRQQVDGSLQGIALVAGDTFGDHHQLEGWMGLSRSGGDITLEVDLWLAHFEQVTEHTPEPAFNYLGAELGLPNEARNEKQEPADEAEETEAPQYWELPPSPIAVPEIQEAGGTVDADLTSPFLRQSVQWQAVHMDVLREVRPMTIDTLNYLDHPALGVLVEVRRYEPEIPEEDNIQ